MRIPRTRRDLDPVAQGAAPTYVTADSHWWDGCRSTAATRPSRPRSAPARAASSASTRTTSCRATSTRAST